MNTFISFMNQAETHRVRDYMFIITMRLVVRQPLDAM